MRCRAGIIFLIASWLSGMIVRGQEQPSVSLKDAMAAKDSQGMTGMNGIPMDNGSGVDALHSMEDHMEMGPHMRMTAMHNAKRGDAERAQQVVEAARKASEKYRDYRAALSDGFTFFFARRPAEGVPLHEHGTRCRGSLPVQSGASDFASV